MARHKSLTEALGDDQEPTTTSRRTRQPVDERPMYQQMRRAEARLRKDQATDLTAFRQKIMDDREEKWERITDNTLIRVAVDMLLAKQDEIRGDTEDALRNAALAAINAATNKAPSD